MKILGGGEQPAPATNRRKPYTSDIDNLRDYTELCLADLNEVNLLGTKSYPKERSIGKLALNKEKI